METIMQPESANSNVGSAPSGSPPLGSGPLMGASSPVHVPAPPSPSPSPSPSPVPEPSISVPGNPDNHRMDFGQGSFPQQIARAAAHLGIGEKVGGWARSLVGATTAVLSGVQDIDTSPAQAGQGILAGMAGTARNESVRHVAEQKQADEHTKNQAMVAVSNMQLMHAQGLIHQQGEEAINRSIASGINERDNLVKSGGVVKMEGVTYEQVKQAGLSNGDDKTGGIDLGRETLVHVGQKITGYDEKTKAPQYSSIYDVVTLPPRYKFNDQKELDEINAHLPATQQKLTLGQEMPGASAFNLKQQAKNNQVVQDAANLALAEAGIKKNELKHQVEWIDLGPSWAKYLAKHHGELQPALDDIQQNPEIMAKFPHFRDDVEKNYGGAKSFQEVLEHQAKDRDDRREKQREFNERENDKRQKAAELKQSNLVGEEFIASLPVAKQGYLRAIGDGRDVPGRAGTKIGQAQHDMINQAFPGYDFSKAPAYLAARKAFTSGKESQGINSFNTVLTHLERAFDHASFTSTAPGVSGVARMFGNKQASALNQDRIAIATELAKAYSGGNLTEGEMREWKEKLDVASPVELKNNLQEISHLLVGKLLAYQSQWDNASPRPEIRPPLAIINPSGRRAYKHITGEALESESPKDIPADASQEVIVNGKVTGHVIGGKYVQAGR